jgi:hypothetical protein
MVDNQQQELMERWESLSSAINAVAGCANAVGMFPRAGLEKDLPGLVETLLDATVGFETLLDYVEAVHLDADAYADALSSLRAQGGDAS